MSETVNHPGTINTLEAAAEQLEGMFGDEEGVVEEATEEEVEVEETEAEVEEVEEADLEEDTEEARIESISDLAEALELSVDDVLGQLRHTVKVDGEQLDVTLSELQAGYQKDRDYRQKTESLKREREAFEAQQTELVRKFEEDHAQNAYVLNTLEQNLNAAMDSEEMHNLRQANQNEWLARRYDIQDRMQQLQNLKAEAAQRYQETQQALMMQAQEKLSETLQHEAALLNEKVEGWGAEKQESLNRYLSDSYGWTPQEISQITDHRLVVLANKAMMYDQQQQAAEQTAKKVRKAPKLVKPSAKPRTVQGDTVRKLKGRLKQSGKLKDAASIIEQML